MKQAFDVGAPVPEPYDFKGNVVVMQFIGTGGIPAPRLIDARATKTDYTAIVNTMKLIYQEAELVHSDLSEYNVMKLDKKIVMFDFGIRRIVSAPVS